MNTLVAPEATTAVAEVRAGGLAPPTLVSCGAGGAYDQASGGTGGLTFNSAPDECAAGGVDHSGRTAAMVPEPEDDDAAAGWDQRSGKVIPEPAHPRHGGDLTQPETIKDIKGPLAERQRAQQYQQCIGSSGGLGPVLWSGGRTARPHRADPTIRAGRGGASSSKSVSGTTSRRAEARNTLIFKPLRNRNHVDPVPIPTAILWVSRAAAATSDQAPSHDRVEPTISFDADTVRAKKTELFHAVPISPEHAGEGQYDGIMLGQKVPAYRGEPDVAVDCGTETYAARKLDINPGGPHTAIRP